MVAAALALAEARCHRASGRLEAPPRLVLVVDTASIGDFVCALPAVNALRALWPGVRLEFAVTRRVEPLCRAFAGAAVPVGTPWSWARAFFLLFFRRRYDLAVSLNDSLPNRFVLLVCRARARAGYFGDLAVRGFGIEVRPLVCSRTAHLTQVRLTVARALDAGGTAPEPGLDYSPLPARRARTRDRGLRVGFCPFSKRVEKNWTAAGFAALGERLRRRTRGMLEIQIFGDASHARESDALAARLGQDCQSRAGRTSLGELADRLGACDLVVSVDSAAMHLAAALQVPLLALFGPTDPACCGPRPMTEFTRVVSAGSPGAPLGGLKAESVAPVLDELVDALLKRRANP